MFPPRLRKRLDHVSETVPKPQAPRPQRGAAVGAAVQPGGPGVVSGGHGGGGETAPGRRCELRGVRPCSAPLGSPLLLCGQLNSPFACRPLACPLCCVLLCVVVVCCVLCWHVTRTRAVGDGEGGGGGGGSGPETLGPDRGISGKPVLVTLPFEDRELGEPRHLGVSGGSAVLTQADAMPECKANSRRLP